MTLNTIEVVPLSVHIGAHIHGCDIRSPLSPDAIQTIRDALLKWKVIFFRNQEMDHAQHVAFARQFGDPTPGHVVFGGDDTYPEIYSVAKNRVANSKRNATAVRTWTGWHTDITAAINPPAASILRGVVVPPYGGDTLWTNLVAAFNALSPTMQQWLSTLHGEHSYDLPVNDQHSAEYVSTVRKSQMTTHHPLIRVHPETGEKALYVSPAFLKSIVGLTPFESDRLMQMLWEHSVLPEYTVRFKWEPGSVAFWDNRSTAHLAPRDIFDSEFDRQFYRVTLNGDVPVGVDGQQSQSLQGDPIAPARPI